jgi:hypothetical protein
MSSHKSVVQAIFQLWRPLSIFVFASIENRQRIVCTWPVYPQALAMDALTISFENLYAYVYPPIYKLYNGDWAVLFSLLCLYIKLQLNYLI